MSENTKLWDILGRTDPKHTKAFTRGGGFKGTAIKPMWSYRMLTEQFGPCGFGWGVGDPSFQVVPGDNREIMVYCTEVDKALADPLDADQFNDLTEGDKARMREAM